MVSLSIDPPPSSRRARSSSSVPRRLLLFALAIIVALGAGFWLGRASAEGRTVLARVVPPRARAVPAAAAAPAAPAAATAPEPSAGAQPSAPPATPAASAAGTGAPRAAAPVEPAGPRLLRVAVSGPLEEAIGSALPGHDRFLAEELTAVVNRLLVWDMHVARDGRRGDSLELLWSPASAGAGSAEPVVDAMRYSSRKLGRTIAAYRFQAANARWARYYRADGSEVEERIADAPVADYEQITSLLKDGRRHKGVDFKTPVGSPVHATFDGVVERRNWNFAGNGNCVDVRDTATGRHAIFLHLEVLPKDVQPGRKVHKGDVIAASGNSGHSFAPHLHYQLESPDGRVLDPFEVHQTQRISLGAADRPAFEAAKAKLDAAMSR